MLFFQLLAACNVVGPGHMCTEMYMESGLTVTLSGDFQPGAYVFEADDGEDVITCELELPDASGEDWITCDDDWGSRIELADADTPSMWRLSEVIVDSIDLRITHDGVEILAETLDELEYEETEYNGEGCDYAYNAEVELAL